MALFAKSQVLQQARSSRRSGSSLDGVPKWHGWRQGQSEHRVAKPILPSRIKPQFCRKAPKTEGLAALKAGQRPWVATATAALLWPGSAQMLV